MQINILASWILLVSAMIMARSSVSGSDNYGLDFQSLVGSVRGALSGLKTALADKSRAMRNLAVQTMRNQIQHEERIRAEGDSGIVQVRSLREGVKNYHSSTATGHSFAALHDHSFSRGILGMREATVVMNGVEFRTAHSDYRLVRPSNSTGDWLAVEPIPVPPVPDSVLAKTTVQDQVTEMIEYFRAFKQQDKSLRDYTPYFRPVQCYMEAAWSNDIDNFNDWFEGENSLLGGNSWQQLHDTCRAEAVTGTKAKYEQNAFLPTSIVTVDEVTGEPVYAQWNYRLLCFPVDAEVPTAFFKQLHEVAYRQARNLDREATILTRGAHFYLDNSNSPGNVVDGFLHQLVSEIPGMDNIPAILSQPALGNPPQKHVTSGQTLNLGYYNHWYDLGFHNGYTSIPRGFSGANLYVAVTSQEKVAAVPVTYCSKRNSCDRHSLRVSYMLPLDVVYLRALHSWNPHRVADFGADNKAPYNGGRNGRTPPRAYSGMSDLFFYQTPIELFSGPPVDPDPSGEDKHSVWVQDHKGVSREVAPSGLRTILPPISGGVGEVRTRYPIAAVHGLGSSVWKELTALEDSLG